MDPVAVAEAMGLRTVAVRLPKGCHGCYLVTEERDYVVVNSEKNDLIERRYTCAHELGHVALARLGIKAKPAIRTAKGLLTGNPKIERRCDRFARNLLMPEQMVRRSLARGASAEEIAREFGAPEYAARTRVWEIGKEKRK